MDAHVYKEQGHFWRIEEDGVRMFLFEGKDRLLWEGTVIDLGFWKFEVILTPGHTPGSIMLLDREKRLLISGDTIQAGDIYMFGPEGTFPQLAEGAKALARGKLTAQDPPREGMPCRLYRCEAGGFLF